MTLTAKQISQMKEAEFQREILIPLFKAMKFRSITPYDGGSLELGKDLVMWREEDLRERINYGVVVKATKISGKATGKGSANEVFFRFSSVSLRLSLILRVPRNSESTVAGSFPQKKSRKKQ